MSSGSLYIYAGNYEASLPKIGSEYKYILNFSTVSLNDSRVIDAQEDYLKIKSENIKEYCEFISSYGEGHFIQTSKLASSKLWWFSEVHHRDNYYHSEFEELLQALLVKKVMQEKDIKDFYIEGEDSYLKYFLGQEKTIPKSNQISTLRLLLSRAKLLVNVYKVKLSSSDNSHLKKSEVLLYSPHPTGWTQRENKFIPRFYEEIIDPIESKSFVSINYQYDNENLQRASALTIMAYAQLSIFQIIFSFLNILPMLKYFFQANKLAKISNYKGINLWPIFQNYLKRTIITDQYFYDLYIKSLKQVIKNTDAQVVITPGEFGPGAKATVIAAREAGVKSVWYQHAFPVEDLLYFHSTDRDLKKHFPMPDELWVWSEKAKSFFITNSLFPAKNIKIVESPKYILKSLDSSPSSEEKTFITFGTNALASEVTLFCTFISQLITMHNVAAKIIRLKLHPKSPIQKNEILQSFPELKNINGIYTADLPLTEITKTSKCFVSGNTNLGLEIGVLNVPVLQYINKYHLNKAPLNQQNSSTFTTIDDLSKQLQNIAEVKSIKSDLFFIEPLEGYPKFKLAVHQSINN